MKRIDFENGNTTSNLLNAAFPMLIAQLLALLYNIVDPSISLVFQILGLPPLGLSVYAFRLL